MTLLNAMVLLSEKLSSGKLYMHSASIIEWTQCGYKDPFIHM